jgi:hypothetical protein
MVRWCLRAHVSMIEGITSQLTTYQVHIIDINRPAEIMFDRKSSQDFLSTPSTALNIPLQNRLLAAQSVAGHLARLFVLVLPMILPC